MPTPARHDPHPLQRVLLGAVRRAAPDACCGASVGAALLSWGLPGSDPHVSRLFGGTTGASAAELFVLLEHVGLDTAATVLARMAGMVAVALPDGSGLFEERRIALLTKLVGDLAWALTQATDAESPGGQSWTPEEAAEVLQRLQPLEAVLADIRARASRC